MAATLTTPPVVEPLTLSDVKSHLKLDGNDDDGLLNRLIIAARQHIETRTGCALINQDWLIYFNNWPQSGQLEFPLFPVSVVSSLKTYNAQDIASLIDPSHYTVNLVARPSSLVLRSSRGWAKPGRPVNGIEVAVQAGFGATADDVPEPIRQAMLLLIAHWYEIRQPSCGEVPGIDLASQLDDLLAPHKQVRL
jgi:uncharacterized phiE125 gp8 family phage protein